MKKKIIAIITILFLVSLITVSVYASNSDAPRKDDEIIFNETYVLKENSILNGNLVAINSTVVVKKNVIITGDVVLIASSINLNAEVNGSLIAFGGIVSLFEETIIHGDLISPGAQTFRAEGSKVFGQIFTSETLTIQDYENFDDINFETFQSDQSQLDNFFNQNPVLNPIAQVLWVIFSSFIVSVVSVFVVFIFRKRTQIISNTLQSNLIESGGFGLVTLIIVFPILTVIFGILVFTVILLPISLLVFILMALLTFVGWVMTCIEIGRMVVTALKREWSDAVIAGIGSFIMTLIITSLNLVFWDIFGLAIGLIVTSLGVGALLLTRFGSRIYKSKKDISSEID